MKRKRKTEKKTKREVLEGLHYLKSQDDNLGLFWQKEKITDIIVRDSQTIFWVAKSLVIIGKNGFFKRTFEVKFLLQTMIVYVDKYVHTVILQTYLLVHL